MNKSIGSFRNSNFQILDDINGIPLDLKTCIFLTHLCIVFMSRLHEGKGHIYISNWRALGRYVNLILILNDTCKVRANGSKVLIYQVGRVNFT